MGFWSWNGGQFYWPRLCLSYALNCLTRHAPDKHQLQITMATNPANKHCLLGNWRKHSASSQHLLGKLPTPSASPVPQLQPSSSFQNLNNSLQRLKNEMNQLEANPAPPKDKLTQSFTLNVRKPAELPPKGPTLGLQRRMSRSFYAGETREPSDDKNQEVVKECMHILREQELNGLMSKLKDIVQDEMRSFKRDQQQWRDGVEMELKRQNQTLKQMQGIDRAAAPSKMSAQTAQALTDIEQRLRKMDDSFKRSQEQLQSRMNEMLKQTHHQHHHKKNGLFSESHTKAERKWSGQPLEIAQKESVVVTYPIESGHTYKKKEIVIDQKTYYMDRQGFLLDGQGYYLLDKHNKQIQIDEKHRNALKKHGLMT